MLCENPQTQHWIYIMVITIEKDTKSKLLKIMQEKEVEAVGISFFPSFHNFQASCNRHALFYNEYSSNKNGNQ